MNATAQRAQFLLTERLVDARNPVGQAPNRPCREQFRKRFRPPRPAPQRTERPIFRTLDQIRTERISLDITANDQKVIVIGNGKALETGPVQMTFAGGMIVGVVTLGMRGRNPAQHPPHQPVLGRPENHVPVIGHQGKREQLHGIAFQAFGQHTEEGLIVLVFVEDGLSCIATIEGVVSRTRFISTFCLGITASNGKDCFGVSIQECTWTAHSTKDPRPLFPIVLLVDVAAEPFDLGPAGSIGREVQRHILA